MWDWLLDNENVLWASALVGGGLFVGATVAAWASRGFARKLERRRNDKLLGALERALRGEPREAFDLLRREAEKPDASPALYFALAAALRRLDMTERSAMVHRGLLARAQLSRADRIRAELGLAADYLQLGRASLAEQILRKLPRVVRRHPRLLSVRRKTALEAGDWKEAIESTSLMVREGSEDQSEMAEIHARMGQQALESGDLKAAAKSFRRALRRDEHNARARFGMAELHAREEKPAQARKHLLLLLDANKGLAPLLLPRIRKTLALESGRERERFVKLLEQLSGEPTAELWVGLEEAEILFAAGKPEAAKSKLQELLERHPKVFELREAYLNFLIESHDDAEALREVGRLLEFAAELLPRFRCSHCGHAAARGFLDCPSCGRFGSAVHG